MPRRKSMSSTGPKGVDAYFPEEDKQATQEQSSGNRPTPLNRIPRTKKDENERIKTTLYMTVKHREFIDRLLLELRNDKPGLTRSEVIRLALDKLADMDVKKVQAELLGYPDEKMA